MRVVIAEDTMLTREGLVRLLEGAGVEVVEQVEDGDALLRKVAAHPARRRDRRHQDAADAHRRGPRRRPADP